MKEETKNNTQTRTQNETYDIIPEMTEEERTKKKEEVLYKLYRYLLHEKLIQN